MLKIKKLLWDSLVSNDYVYTQGFIESHIEQQELNSEYILTRNLYDSKTLVIAGFPGVGKSHTFNNVDLNILDSDSSKFDKKDFPENYIAHIKENLGVCDIIFVSTHKEVREALKENNIPFVLVYPEKELLSEYKHRYFKRGNRPEFIDFIESNWDTFINDIICETKCFHLQLKTNQYISDFL